MLIAAIDKKHRIDVADSEHELEPNVAKAAPRPPDYYLMAVARKTSSAVSTNGRSLRKRYSPLKQKSTEKAWKRYIKSVE